MNLDIRVPIGLLFTILGGLLVAFGLATGNQAIYRKSLDLNINLWWGLILLVFGVLMAFFGRRKSLKSVEGPSPHASTDIPRAH